MSSLSASPSAPSGVTGATSIKQCRCTAGYFTPYGETGRVCYECPVGAICAGGKNPPFPKGGFWQSTDHRYQNVFVQCKPADLCLIGGYCAFGYRGNLCSECRPGHYRRGLRCYPCTRGYQLSGGATLALLLGFAISLCAGMYFLASAEALQRSATVYVCVYFAQSLHEFDSLTMPWPKIWQIVFSSLSPFNFDLQQARGGREGGREGWWSSLHQFRGRERDVD